MVTEGPLSPACHLGLQDTLMSVQNALATQEAREMASQRGPPLVSETWSSLLQLASLALSA